MYQDSPYGMARPAQSAMGRMTAAPAESPYGTDPGVEDQERLFEEWLKKMAAQQAAQRQSQGGGGGGSGNGIMSLIGAFGGSSGSGNYGA